MLCAASYNGGGGGAVYLSVGGNGNTSDTFVTMTGCSITSNIVYGL